VVGAPKHVPAARRAQVAQAASRGLLVSAALEGAAPTPTTACLGPAGSPELLTIIRQVLVTICPDSWQWLRLIASSVLHGLRRRSAQRLWPSSTDKATYVLPVAVWLWTLGVYISDVCVSGSAGQDGTTIALWDLIASKPASCSVAAMVIVRIIERCSSSNGKQVDQGRPSSVGVVVVLSVDRGPPGRAGAINVLDR